MRYSAYFAAEDDIRPSRLVREGETAYTYTTPSSELRWGDVAGIAVDPFDDKTIWIAHQYGSKEVPPKENNYRIWISKVFWSLPFPPLHG